MIRMAVAEVAKEERRARKARREMVQARVMPIPVPKAKAKAKVNQTERPEATAFTGCPNRWSRSIPTNDLTALSHGL